VSDTPEVANPTGSFPHKLTVGRVTVEQIPETQKRNPNSLRFLIGHILGSYFESHKQAVEKLRQWGGIYKGTRRGAPAKNINVKALSGILADKEYIAYWHLEIFAKQLGIPTGALLFISRLFANMRYGKSESNEALVRCIKDFASNLEALSKKKDISKDDFEAVRRCFESLDEIESRAPRLF
jgi:hypothetical protein